MAGTARPAAEPLPSSPRALASDGRIPYRIGVLPEVLLAADSVRRLSVAIVLLSSSFNRTLTTAEIERVHEEVVEFYDFYQQHGAGRVDFDFALVEVDRPLARRDIAEVGPDRYYLSRDDLEAELVGRGFRGRFDEVIALHAWSNANPERALQAYGGGAVGPDGRFLGDAGFNSIPVMGRDPNTIGQVLIHEVLHNLDDMFARSGMPDAFLNADEMSRNMPLLLRERPGAFLPRYTDAEMLAYARRERQGREAYPWAMQLVYYAWMLERTPRADWDRLRYGRFVPAGAPAVRPLYSAVHTSAANDEVYLPVLARGAAEVRAGRFPLAPRSYAQADFDGTPLRTGVFHAGWVPLPPDRRDTVVVPVGDTAGVMVVRQRVAHVAAPADLVRYVEDPVPLAPRVVADRRGAPAESAPRASVRITGGDPASMVPGTYDLTHTAAADGWYVHPARTRLVVRRRWSARAGDDLTVSLGAPAALVADVRDDRGRDDAVVTAEVAGRVVPLALRADGRYAVTVEEELPWGLHWARVTARLGDGTAVTDSQRLYVRPGGWIRVGDIAFREPEGRIWLDATLVGRLGREVRASQLPLVAIVADRATPLAWDSVAGRYEAFVWAPPEADRVVVAALTGDSQRRTIPIMEGRNDVDAGRTRRVDAPPTAAAVRLVRPPAIDGDLADWPPTEAAAVPIGPASTVLTDTATYRGAADLAGEVRFAWDDSTLYVAGAFTDDAVETGESWNADRVNLVLDMRDDTTPLTYPTPDPSLDQWQEDDHWVFWRAGSPVVRRFGRRNADPLDGARLATRRTTGGWSFEAALPAAGLPGFVPFVGQVAGLQVFVTDGDEDGRVAELMWAGRWPYNADGIQWRLAELARLLFVDAPIR
jgi:hypothetical protein